MSTIQVQDDAGLDRYGPPRRAAIELPDQATVAELGMTMPVDEARLVLVTLSRYLAASKAKTRSFVHPACAFLALACTLTIERDGDVWEPAHPQLADRSWPCAVSAFGHLGIDHHDLAAYWRTAKDRADDSCYPLEWMQVFFPLAIWPAVLTLIKWGPDRARIQFEEAAIVSARTPIKRPSRRRAAGSPLALATIDSRVTSVWSLMQTLIELRTRVKASTRPTLPIPLLGQWTARPPRPNLLDCGALPAGIDNSGPTLEQCQTALKQLARDYDSNTRRRYHRLRRLLLLAICTLLGPRADAVRSAKVDDYQPNRPWPDGIIRPTLVIYPGKSRAHHEPHFLPLPAELAAWLEQWIELTGRSIGQQDEPLFPGRTIRNGKRQPLGQVGFYGAIAGRSKADGRCQRALIPIADDRSVGMRPHGFRHASSQLAYRAAVALKTANPGIYDHFTPEDFTRALLAQSLIRSVADVYRDLNRERLTCALVDSAWKILWGTGTTRLGLDPAAIAAATTRLSEIDSEIAAAEASISQTETTLAQLAAEGRRLSGDAVTKALIESNALAATLAERTRTLITLHNQKPLAEKELEQALATEIELPTELSDDEHRQLLSDALATANGSERANVDKPLAA